MFGSSYGSWARASYDARLLGVEASAVIGLRVAKFASGGDLEGVESRLMVTEKLHSLAKMQLAALRGELGATPLASTETVIRHYRAEVSENRQRLTSAF